MANCKNCGGELFETSKFCPHCGAPVLELSSRSEGEKVKNYSSDDASDNVEGLPEVNTGVLTPEEQAAVLEMAAENILEDIPDIKKIEDDGEIKESTSAGDDAKKDEAPETEAAPAAPVKEEPHKPAEEKAPETDNVPENKPQTATVSAEPAKKSKGGIIAVIAIVAAAAICGAVFFLKPQNTPAPPLEIEQTEISEAVTEETAIEADAEISVVTETELAVTEASAETEISAEAELTSETVISEESVTESETSAEETTVESQSETSETIAETAPAGSHTADELTAGIVIEPAGHTTAMGNAVSAEIKLSDEGIGTDILSSGVLFLAEYTSTASAPANITPASMVITVNGTAVDVAATSCSEGMVIFEYDKMTEAVTAAGFSPADIDDISIKTTGVPIDVYKITILNS